MKIERLKEIIGGGESITVEFKQSKTKLNKDVFESVCAFLNRDGGHLFLGVEDKGCITGIDLEAVERVKKEFVSSMNNPQKISPAFYLSVEEVKIDGKTILCIFVPESSQVHRCNGKIFDRNEDGDINITDNTNLVSGMYIRKQGNYTENRIFPFAELSEMNTDLFTKVRKLAANQKPNHPWKSLDDLELLKSAGLYLKDPQSGKEGITLGGILLFGNEQLIHAALPHYRTDAILRREDTDRYDDRDDIRSNLIESYERLMQFISKHLNDKFYLEKDQRISLRDKIYREVISNILIHREFANPFPAKLVIEKDRVFTENSNKPHGNGIIDPDNFSPFPKNPAIAKFFKEIGWVDELGSGVRNIYKYNKIYSGADPTFIEGDVFKTIIPLIPQAGAQVRNGADMDGSIQESNQANNHVSTQAITRASNQASNHAGDRTKIHNEDAKIKALLTFCREAKTRSEIQEFLGFKSRKHTREKFINPLIKSGFLRLTEPDSPRSPTQKYIYKI